MRSRELQERLTALAYALAPLIAMLCDAEQFALRPIEREGLLRARMVVTKIQVWAGGKSINGGKT